jgi:hypothetical protein
LRSCMHSLHGYISVERKERLPFVHDILDAMEYKEEWEGSSEIVAVIATEFQATRMAAGAFGLGGGSCKTQCMKVFMDAEATLQEQVEAFRKKQKESGGLRRRRVARGRNVVEGEGGSVGCPHEGCVQEEKFEGGSDKVKALLKLAIHHMQDHVLSQLGPNWNLNP